MNPISTKEFALYSKSETDSENHMLMPVSTHLNELRRKIIISLIAFCLSTLVGFLLSKNLINLLIRIMTDEITFLQIKPGELFFTSLRVAVYFGIIVALPVIIWQLGSFIVPGLKATEKKAVVPILVGAPVLFTLGIVFAYFFVAPSALNFLFGFGKDIIPASISIESFISFTLMIMAICGFVFLLPVTILAFANARIVNSKILIVQWRYALLGSVILGSVLTPTPDPFNMMLVSSILIVLYFLSWGILRLLNK